LGELFLKFKGVIIFFNVLMLLFLGVVFVLPFIVLGREFALGFWRSSWFMGPLILGVLLVIDGYFLVNSRVLILLEKEDWPPLIQELEHRVYHKGRYTPRLVKLLANTYLVLSDAHSVTELEKKLSIVKSRLVDENALIFGTARILSKDNAGAAEFFSARLPGGAHYAASSNNEWIRWYFAFSLLLSRDFEAAANAFIVLAQEGKDGILTGLSAYFLEDNLSRFLPRRAAELRKEAQSGKERVKQRLRYRTSWNKEYKQNETEVYSAVLSSYVDKAGDYIYA
jgi:hypothetical protein